MGPQWALGILLFSVSIGLPSVGRSESPSPPDPCGQAQRIPPRFSNALSATQFLQRVQPLDDDARESAIRNELLAGNLPQFLHRLVPVKLHVPAPISKTVTLCSLPDYISIGSDLDFVITPMRLGTALRVARQFGFLLPTARMVDAIYAQSNVHLAPQPLAPSADIRSVAYFKRHNTLILAQRAALDSPLDLLIAGHKKDLVLTNRLWAHPRRVAIYGWHRIDGHPIQPLSTVHDASYADYSHGVRLISDTAYVDGVATPLLKLLQDTQYAFALTGEGPIQRITALLGMLMETDSG